MLSISARLSVLALVLGLTAVTTSPAFAGLRGASCDKGEPTLTVELARGVVSSFGTKVEEQYAPTGETIDLTVPVVATRL